jgi:hypothetical protein
VDGTRPRGGAAPRTAILVGLAALLLAVVALASRDFEAGPESQRAQTPLGDSAPGVVTGALIVLSLVGVIATTVVVASVLAGLARRRKKPDEEMFAESPPRPWWLGPLLILIVLAMFALPIGLLVWVSGMGGHSPPPSGAAGFADRSVAPAGQARGGAEPTSPDWALVAVAAGISVVGLLILTRGRRKLTASPVSSPRGAMAEAVQETIEDIDREPDPRRAIISAYARMERVLATHGWARKPSRSPLEYLEESLQRLAVPAVPARSLTELFEIAKFSHHRVDISMKRRAIDALVAVRQALEGEGS